MKKVLVIDDDPDILEAVQLILEAHGYESSTITRGVETCENVIEYKPDLIILDVLLSGDDGRRICKELKDDPKTCHIPIIMMSAHPDALQSVKESGAESFISKPFSMKQITDEIEKYMA